MNKRSPKVMYWDDERSIGNSLIVTLNYGFRFGGTDVEHVRGFDTVREANADIKDTRLCFCPECTAALANMESCLDKLNNKIG